MNPAQVLRQSPGVRTPFHKQSPAQQAYARFLTTPTWLNLRQQCLRRDGHLCRQCGSERDLQAHHQRYPHWWMDTVLSDLVTLCQPCHAYRHGLTKQKPKKLQNAERLRRNWHAMAGKKQS